MTYTTCVNPYLFAYNTGLACGFRPGDLPISYNRQNSINPFAGIYTGTFCSYNGIDTIKNIFQATNTNMFGTTNVSTTLYNFGGTMTFGNSVSNPSLKSSNTSNSSNSSSKAASKSNSSKKESNSNNSYIKSNSKYLNDARTKQKTQYSYVPKKIDTSMFAKNAKKYLGVSESNKGHLKFIGNLECHRMDPFNEEWCTDFVTYVTKESYQKQGLKVPYWFGSHDVATLKRQAITHNSFINTASMSDKDKYISENIKAGDIMILNQNNASHTGFVTKVNTDGSFETIEGNVGDVGGDGDGRVTVGFYSPYDEDLSGFIRLT